MSVVKVHTAECLSFWCPACDETHSINYGRPNSWQWNGSEDRPTITPSVLVTGKRLTVEGAELDRMLDDPDVKELPSRPLLCHSFVTDERIRYLSDCLHDMRDQTVPLPEVRLWRYN